MKALRYHGPNILEYEDVPDLSPKKGEVKLKVRAVGICGSDVHGYLGLTGRRIPPMTMGHEFSGEVVELGEGVTKAAAGDRVAVFPFGFDGTCDTCKQGNFTLCENRILYGVLTDDGAFADYLCVTEGTCVKLAPATPFEAGALIEPLTVGYHATDRYPVELYAGKTVLIVGAGMIGLAALLGVKRKNPARIIVSDVADNRLALAKKLGATDTLNPTRDDVPAKVMEMTNGKGADIGLEAVGAAKTVQTLMSSLRPNSHAVWIGNNQRFIEVNMQEIVTRELTVTGTNSFSLAEFQNCADDINSGAVDVSPIISAKLPMAQGADAFEKLHTDPGDWIKVVLVNA